MLPFCLQGYCQIIISDPTGIAYFEKGSQQLAEGNFKEADSLLTLSLKTFKNKNVYFNRSLARVFNGDTLGFCSDLSINTSRYQDAESEKLFNEYCCYSVDTIYYNRRREISHKNDFRYFEIIKKIKIENITVGNFYDIKSRGGSFYVRDVALESAEEFLGMYNSNSVASYMIQNGRKLYSRSTTSVELRNYGSYNELNKKLSTYFTSRYGHLKDKKDTDYILVFQIFFNELGRCYNVEYLGCSPKIELSEEVKALINKELKSYIKQFPMVKPARFFDEKVAFTNIDFIEF